MITSKRIFYIPGLCIIAGIFIPGTPTRKLKKLIVIMQHKPLQG